MLTLILATTAFASAADETPAPAPETAPAETPAPAPAPAPAAVDLAMVIGNVRTGYTAPLEKKALMVLFRGMNANTPGGERLLIYLPPAHDPALVAALDRGLGWSVTGFERLRLQVDSAVGRPLYKQLQSSLEVAAAVGADPGAIGVVSGATLLDERVTVLWRSGGDP